MLRPSSFGNHAGSSVLSKCDLILIQRVSLPINWGIAKLVLLHQVMTEGNLLKSVRELVWLMKSGVRMMLSWEVSQDGNSIITRMKENARMASHCCWQDTDLDLSLLTPVVNDTPWIESCVINEDTSKLMTPTNKRNKHPVVLSCQYRYYIALRKDRTARILNCWVIKETCAWENHSRWRCWTRNWWQLD